MTAKVVFVCGPTQERFTSRLIGNLGLDVKAVTSFQDSLTLDDIGNCDGVVFVASDDALNSDMPARNFIDLAQRHGRPIIVIRMTDQPLDWLNSLQIVDQNRRTTQNVRRAIVNIPSRIFDITNRADLIRYVVRTQLHRLKSSVADVAKNGFDEAELTGFLAGGPLPSARTFRTLDRALVTIGHAKAVVGGGIAQFAIRMSDPVGDLPDYMRLPPDWAIEALRGDNDGEVDTLTHASIILGEFVTATNLGLPSESIRTHYHATITDVVRRLILLASGLQNARYIEAQLLLAGLGRFAIESVKEGLDASLSSSPLGYRSWRSVTRLIAVATELSEERDAHLIEHIKVWVLDLAENAESLRKLSILPARSLDIECFVSIPAAWVADEPVDRIARKLLARARDPRASLRERASAAMGVWQRAVVNQRFTDLRFSSEMDMLLSELEEAADSIVPSDDSASGLRWIASTLRKAVQNRSAVCTDLPRSDEPWHQAVHDVAESLGQGLPEHLADPTRALFRQAVLQNSSVEQRRAIDALRAGGLTDPIASSLVKLFHDSKSTHWIRMRSLYALGFLRARSQRIQDELTKICNEVAGRVIAGSAEVNDIELLSEALFTLAEVFGFSGVEDRVASTRAGRVREGIATTLVNLVEKRHTVAPDRHSVARALAYLLTFTAQDGEDDLSRRLLLQLMDHDDMVTHRFSSWALKFRWEPADFVVRSLLHGAKYNPAVG